MTLPVVNNISQNLISIFRSQSESDDSQDESEPKPFYKRKKTTMAPRKIKKSDWIQVEIPKQDLEHFKNRCVSYLKLGQEQYIGNKSSYCYIYITNPPKNFSALHTSSRTLVHRPSASLWPQHLQLMFLPWWRTSV